VKEDEGSEKWVAWVVVVSKQQMHVEAQTWSLPGLCPSLLAHTTVLGMLDLVLLLGFIYFLTMSGRHTDFPPGEVTWRHFEGQQFSWKKKKGYLQLKLIKFKFIYIVLYIMWISLIFIQISWTTLWRGTRVHVVSVLRSVCLFTCYHDNCHKIRTVTSLVPHFPPVRSPSDIPYVHLLLWKHHKNCAREAADGL